MPVIADPAYDDHIYQMIERRLRSLGFHPAAYYSARAEIDDEQKQSAPVLPPRIAPVIIRARPQLIVTVATDMRSVL